MNWEVPQPSAVVQRNLSWTETFNHHYASVDTFQYGILKFEIKENLASWIVDTIARLILAWCTKHSVGNLDTD